MNAHNSSSFGYLVSSVWPGAWLDNQYLSPNLECLRNAFANFAMLFYIVTPNETKFETVEEIPDYIMQVAASAFMLTVVEMVACSTSAHLSSYRTSDVLASMSSGIVYLSLAAPSQVAATYLYQKMYEYRFLTLDWSSSSTWWTAAVAVDFCFYWFHRYAHETNVGWASHQIHHSSEQFNLTTSVRQSALLKLYTVLFYLPLAMLGFPITSVLVHMQLNVIFQMWLHTDVVSTLGPLEWIFNTPSHHRVHHGSEAWCLDKNYAGVLIIWDRLFGTFQSEVTSRQIVYGLVDQPQSVNPVYIEVVYFQNLYMKFRDQATWADSFKSLFFGPGWTPGSPRLGFPLPDQPTGVPKRKKYDPHLSRFLELYTLIHIVMAFFIQRFLTLHFASLSVSTVTINTAFVVSTVFSIGALYDGWASAMPMEALRCIFYFIYSAVYPLLEEDIVNRLILVFLAFSIVFWISQSHRTNLKYFHSGFKCLLHYHISQDIRSN
ncbi:Fatty acid hydroxylase [Trinorchestia longiramus]|nr:Fatty acid hydroxylase [Trinorchestia longiramus]